MALNLVIQKKLIIKKFPATFTSCSHRLKNINKIHFLQLKISQGQVIVCKMSINIAQFVGLVCFTIVLRKPYNYFSHTAQPLFNYFLAQALRLKAPKNEVFFSSYNQKIII